MYPRPELIRLAAHKAVLRRSVARQRAACAVAAARVVEPVQWLDRIAAAWRRLAPLAPLLAVPLGCWAVRAAPPRVWRWLLRWGPVAVGSIRGMTNWVTDGAGQRVRPGAVDRGDTATRTAGRTGP